MSFNAWKEEKAIAALVEEAQALSDRLGSAKPHILDAHAAAARFWAAVYKAEGQDLYALSDWPPAAIARLVKTLTARIAALRKARDYDKSDGLVVWLHTARALQEPRIAPPLREIWTQIMATGPNADAMAEDLTQEEGLTDLGRHLPKGL